MRIPEVSWRVGSAIAAGVVVVVAIGVGLWFWSDVQSRRATEALAEALSHLSASRGRDAAPEARAAAVRDLEAALTAHPSGQLAPQAALELGNARYAERDYARARGAWEIAATRGSSPTLRTLARAGIGYAWEAERNYPKAAEVFQAAVTELKPTDFYYEDLLVDLARVQELAGQKTAAIETYRRLLKEVPSSLRADDVRSRLASLGAAP